MDRWNKWRQNRRDAQAAKAERMKGKPVDSDAPTVIMIEVKDVPREVNGNCISKGTERAYQFIHRKILRGRNDTEDFELLFLSIQKPEDRPEGRPLPTTRDFRTEADFGDIELADWTDGLRLLLYLVGDMNRLRIPCRGRIREGVRHMVIFHQATQPNDLPDFLVVEGPRPRPLLGRMLGVNKEINVGKYCLQHTNCPVMVFRFVAEEEEQRDDTRRRQVTEVSS